MAIRAITVQRRDLENLLQTAGPAQAVVQGTTGDDQSAVFVIVLADTDEEQAPAVDGAATVAAVEDTGVSAAPSRRDALARRRREICKTQEDLARDVGVQRSTVARWEAGDTTPSLWARPRIADALEVTLDLLDGLLKTPSVSRQQPPTSAVFHAFEQMGRCG